MARLALQNDQGTESSCSLSLDYHLVSSLVSKLVRDVALFVHFAIRALRLDSVAAAETAALAQDAGRHHEGLNEHLRIFNRHVVSEFISNTREFLDDMHAAGVEEAPAS